MLDWVGWEDNRTVHVIKVGDFGYIANVNDSPFLNQGRNFGEDFVHDVEVGIVVWVAEADDDKAVVFAEDGLVDVPACDEVGEKDGAHVGGYVRRDGGCTEVCCLNDLLASLDVCLLYIYRKVELCVDKA